MLVKWEIDRGFRERPYSGEWEVDDDITDEDLDEMMQDELNNRIEYRWIRPTPAEPT